MRNPFKVGDKVVRLPEWRRTALWVCDGEVHTVEEADYYRDGSPRIRLQGVDSAWDAARFRAAIAGRDYPVCIQPEANSGHLSDGSSVQKHSAGPLYPCVIAMRDGILGGKYDYGVISPRNQEPLWLSTHETAVSVAETIKKDLT